MSTSLGELLEKKREQYEETARKNESIIDEWKESLMELYQTLRDWLSEADPKHILQVKQGVRALTEPSLGQYEVPDLSIRAFGKWVGVIPKARKTVGTAIPPQLNAPVRATGRVDITDEIRRYCLYRFQDGTQDRWYIVDPTTDVQEELTQQRFEAAVSSYFQ